MTEIEDANDPHGLLRTLVSFGVVVHPVDGRGDRYTAICPFDGHPEIVDTLTVHRDRIAANPDAAAHADNTFPGWRDQTRWRPAFTIAPLHGVFMCFGCGAHGDLTDLVAQLRQRQAAG